MLIIILLIIGFYRHASVNVQIIIKPMSGKIKSIKNDWKAATQIKIKTKTKKYLIITFLKSTLIVQPILLWKN